MPRPRLINTRFGGPFVLQATEGSTGEAIGFRQRLEVTMNCPKLLCALVLVLLGGPARAATMTAHFVDIGQGAATILEFSCGAACSTQAASSSDWPRS